MRQFDFSLPYGSRRVPIIARNIVATSQPLAVQAGVRALQQGGNAMDAALTAAITLTVVEPTGNGLGSDAFAIVWDGNELHGLNASGRSPAGWTAERFAGRSKMPSRGWESVTVPGAVSSWVELSRRFGKLPFAQLFGPAIHYARDGFHVSPTISERWAIQADLLSPQPNFAATFLPDGRPLKAGEMFRNPFLADSLEKIAASEGRAFYEGELAEKIAQFAREHDAVLSESDLAEHRADWCGTISVDFRGVQLHEIPPNGQGIAALIALGILNHTNIADLKPDTLESYHLQIEAMKLAFGDVARFVGDPDAMDVGHELMLDPNYLEQRAKLIDPDRALEPTAGPLKGSDTVYLTTADAAGMMVSFIQSNYSGFGSGVVVPETGIHLQNRGSGFSLEPGHPNVVGPRKRPRHTIIPGFLMRGNEPLMSFGVMGGDMQPQGHVQMVLRTQVFGQNPQAAADAPRWRVVTGRKISLEHHVPDAVKQGLAAKGHDVMLKPPDAVFAFGGAQLIHRLADGYIAGSDPRKDGAAMGF